MQANINTAVLINNPTMVLAKGPGLPIAYFAPAAHHIDPIRKLVAASPAIRSRLYITAAARNRNALIAQSSDMLAEKATSWLARTRPEFSARYVPTGWQIATIALLALGMVSCIVSWPVRSITTLSVLACFIYAANILYRLALFAEAEASSRQAAEQRTERRVRHQPYEQLPVYSILVALYHEANQITGLVEALERLEWPQSRLEIKLVCEADDHETLDALAVVALPSHFEVLRCPALGPRTKPKALDFALPLINGEFVVLYDAEDRPHPLQLKEAYGRFRADHDLACLQAPLAINNFDDNWLTRMFAIEYSMLFDGMFPVWVRWGMPVPLGGTSNHFRRQTLIEIGAWDPFNVTEDADLGLRLSRLGNRCARLVLPTYEEAPPLLDVWLKQRTRWMKGWMQTWLVLMRHPLRLLGEWGFCRCGFFHLTMTVPIVSFLIHPLSLVAAAIAIPSMATDHDPGIVARFVLATGLVNLAGCYAIHIAFARYMTASRYPRRLVGSAWLMPIYWLLISVAGWRAIWHLTVRPFHWEKTPHGLAQQTLPSGRKKSSRA